MEFYSNASYFCHVVPPPPPLPTPPPIEMEEPPTPPFYREPGKLFDRDSCEYLIHHVGHTADNKYIYCLLSSVDQDLLGILLLETVF